MSRPRSASHVLSHANSICMVGYRQSLCRRMMRLPYPRTGHRRVSMPLTATGFTPDVLFTKITELLKELRADEPGLVRYLESLRCLKTCPLLTELGTVTRLQFQAQLYTLTTQGGPCYPSHSVRAAAFSTLDALYPAGARTRKLISLLFKIFHPLSWPRTTATMAKQTWTRLSCFIFFFFSCIVFCLRFVMKPFIR